MIHSSEIKETYEPVVPTYRVPVSDSLVIVEKLF